MVHEIALFLQSGANRALRDNTVAHYREVLERLHEHLLEHHAAPGTTDFPVRRVTPDMLIGYNATFRARKFKPSTVNNYITIIKEFFAFLKLAGKTRANPAATLRCVRDRQRPRQRAPKYDGQKLRQLVDGMSGLPQRRNVLRDRAALALISASGLRSAVRHPKGNADHRIRCVPLDACRDAYTRDDDILSNLMHEQRMSRLLPDERRALQMRGEGYNNREIMRALGIRSDCATSRLIRQASAKYCADRKEVHLNGCA